MAAQTRVVNVRSRAEMQTAVQSYIAQGFTVQQQTEDSTTMFKAKEFSVLWAVVGLILCLLPLLIYLIVYATQSDQMVIIRIVGSGEMPPAPVSPSM